MSKNTNLLHYNLHFNTFKKYAIEFGCYKPNQSGKGVKKACGTKYPLKDILAGKYPEYQTFKLKNRLIKEGIKENKCEICGITEWNNLPITLQAHHMDGDRTNNTLENLSLLCPNCHSQTDNFCSKNIKKSPVSDEALIKALQEQPSIRQALLSVGLSGKVKLNGKSEINY